MKQISLFRKKVNVVDVVVLLFLLLCYSKVRAEEKRRPFILVTSSERSSVIEKIETQEWAKSIYTKLIGEVNRNVQVYEENPEEYLRKLPFNWSHAKQGQYPPFFHTVNIDNGVHRNLDLATDEEWASAAQIINYLKIAKDCGVAYYISQDEKYAQLATDILYSFVKAVQQSKVSDWHGRGGWLFPYDGFREVRVIGKYVPLVYDFVAEFIKKGGKAYDIIEKNRVDFPLEEAQKVFRTYADISINYGQTGSNHPVLEAPNLVYNAMAIDNEQEREELLSYFLTTSTKNQDALPVFVENFKEKGDIWPETSQYLNHSTSIITNLMLILNRYDPSLKLAAKYPNVLHALPRLDYFVYPNQELVRWGDGKRYGTASYESFEDAYVLAKMDGLEDIQEKFGLLINRAKQEGKYKRKGIESVFWYENDVVGNPESFSLGRTDRVYHAGIFLQRNLSSTQKAKDGLMCFVGGAHMVHGHAEGMNIELYGEGQVLGVDHGRGKYGLEFHENYSRIFAAHNTVIVNGSSQGEGGWANLGINSVELISMEPQVGQEGVSPNYSFTQTRFEDDRGDKAEATQERTLALIRTSPTTGYYVDVFRSKSKLPNEYHDYLYHNIGDTLTFENLDMSFNPTPDRYMANAHIKWKRGQYRNPGWHYFKDVNTSSEYKNDVKAQFAVQQLNGDSIYMNLYIPGFGQREYSNVNAPNTFQTIAPYDTLPTPTIVIRQKGEAWKNPFVVVYEPFSASEKKSTIQSVEKLEQNGIYKGLKINSKTSSGSLVQYVITQSKGEVYEDLDRGIYFKGTFAVITTDDKDNLQNMYIGEGEKLVHKKIKLKGNKNKRGYKTY